MRVGDAREVERDGDHQRGRPLVHQVERAASVLLAERHSFEAVVDVAGGAAQQPVAIETDAAQLATRATGSQTTSSDACSESSSSAPEGPWTVMPSRFPRTASTRETPPPESSSASEPSSPTRNHFSSVGWNAMPDGSATPGVGIRSAAANAGWPSAVVAGAPRVTSAARPTRPAPIRRHEL